METIVNQMLPEVVNYFIDFFIQQNKDNSFIRFNEEDEPIECPYEDLEYNDIVSHPELAHQFIAFMMKQTASLLFDQESHRMIKEELQAKIN